MCVFQVCCLRSTRSPYCPITVYSRQYLKNASWSLLHVWMPTWERSWSDLVLCTCVKRLSPSVLAGSKLCFTVLRVSSHLAQSVCLRLACWWLVVRTQLGTNTWDAGCSSLRQECEGPWAAISDEPIRHVHTPSPWTSVNYLLEPGPATRM